ncbi:MAG: type III secretion system chaperone [Pseudomonadota bacterium]
MQTLLSALLLLVSIFSAQAEEMPIAPMNNARITELLERLDFETVGEDGFWRVVLNGRTMMIVTDENADRMRIMSPVTAADALDQQMLLRLMQANFDSALDARYAIARGTLWSAFIHPLTPLSDEEFLTGLGQVFNLAETFGESYSSGLLIFGGGDSADIREKQVIEELLEKGLSI